MDTFSAGDYVVFLATIGISLTIGLAFAIRERNKTTPDDYFLAGRNFRILPASLSFVVTFQSSLMILGAPVEVYLYGTAFCYNFVGIVLSYVFAGIAMVPVFHSLQLTSVYKYFEIRYQNNVVRYMIMSGAVVYIVFYVATVTYGTCVALDLVVGIPFWATVLLYTTITTVYTSVGGIKAVIWTDVFQFLIMVTGVLAVHIKTAATLGGLGQIFDIAASRFNMDDFRFDLTTRYNIWNVSSGSFCIFMYCAYAQAGIQRVNSTPTVRSARWLYVISGPIYATIWVLTSLQGITVFAYHSSNGCDLVASDRIGNVNGLMPITIIGLFKNTPGMAGLFIASLSSAALSTLSSCLNSLSAITYEDIIKVKFPNISEKRATLTSKIVVIIYGFIGMALTFAISRIPGSVAALFMAFMGCMEGPTVAIFMMSTMFRRSTTKGMVAGWISGAAFTLWISIGRMLSDLKPDPILPPGPVEKCSPYNVTVTNSFTFYNHTNAPIMSAFVSHNTSSSSMKNITTVSFVSDDQNSTLALRSIYSVSIIAYSFIGMVIAVAVGVIVSLLTSPPKFIDERCLFSFAKHVCGKQDSQSDETDHEEEMTPMDIVRRM